MLKRSNWKGPFINEFLFNKTYTYNKKVFKTTTRNSVILPLFIGKTAQIHNGKFFIPLIIREDMLGHRFGEFVLTRLRHIYKHKKKNGSKIKSK